MIKSKFEYYQVFHKFQGVTEHRTTRRMLYNEQWASDCFTQHKVTNNWQSTTDNEHLAPKCHIAGWLRHTSVVLWCHSSKYLRTPSEGSQFIHLNVYHHPARIFLKWTMASSLRLLVSISATWLVDSIAFISISPTFKTNGTLMRYVCSWVSLLTIQFLQELILLGCLPTVHMVDLCYCVIWHTSSSSFSKFHIGNKKQT